MAPTSDNQDDILITDSITRLDAPQGKVIVAASHGAIYAAYLAAKAQARAVILNDASVGRDGAGISGLAYLAGFGLPAATIAHDSARIGDGADMIARGRISHANASAGALGVIAWSPRGPGMPTHLWPTRLTRSATRPAARAMR